MYLRKVISGGQTGADQGALSACRRLGVSYGGWVPKGRRTEKGRVPAHYRMRQHWSRHYPPRTEKNIVDSDGTIIFTFGALDGGSLLTRRLARQHRRPCLHVDLLSSRPDPAGQIARWIRRRLPRGGVLNVAGSRRSKAPGIHLAVRRTMTAVLRRLAAESA